ncbi:LGFP repeat-containing protein [Corynebacterium comes]|uniref:LGFP repeat protein n=1 Tax=Corynebacterium comes TaxID=2675218 RepID=A0A6B8VYL3_9CORY|nr:hypothetical protein [Corynebacterium comes]QGU04135.1 LGFP repeat protein [Corynebacterium comes]
MKSTILTRRILAGAAAATLAFGVVACADDGDTAGESTVTTTDAAGEETEVERDEVEASTPSVAEDAEEAEDGEGAEPTGDEVEYETTEGNVVIPAAAAAAFDEYAADWGAPETVETNNIGHALAIFQGGNLVSFSEAGGAIPIGGEIGNTWLEDGGLENTIGLPTGPEQAAPEGNGWIQEFENGTISWLADEDGEFSADVQEN